MSIPTSLKFGMNIMAFEAGLLIISYLLLLAYSTMLLVAESAYR
jgi:hypothetical protein